MRLRLMTTIAGLAMTVGLMAAQPSTTVLLRSGEQFTGQLVDLGGSGFAFNVNGQEREIQPSDVVYIDFGGGNFNVPNEVVNLPGGQHAAVLQNGSVVVGEFYDVGGRQPLRITFRTSSGERELSSNDVRRIYLNRAEGNASTPSGNGQGRTINVSATVQWTPTNLTVRQGQNVQFQSSGQVNLDRNGVVSTPGGNPGMFDRQGPLPTTPTGALIGRIGGFGARGGGGTPFLIGTQNMVVMPANGQLFLGINDRVLNDNSGTYQVQVTPNN